MSRQRPQPYVVYHQDCPDGYGAAYIAWLVLKDQAHYVPMAYGAPLPQFKDRANLYFIDFSPTREQLLDLIKDDDRFITILDHHVTAMTDLAGISDEWSQIWTVFDMDKSGIGISWEYWMGKDIPLPPVLANLQDRDLWRNALPNTEEIYQAMESYPKAFEIWHDLITIRKESAYNRLVTIGEALVRQQHERIKVLAREPRFATVNGTEYGFPAVNAPYFMASDLGSLLLDMFPTAPFAATYRDLSDGRRSWSFRSRDDRVDVGALATSLGGGGHRNAAGAVEQLGKHSGLGDKIYLAWNLKYDPDLVVTLTQT